MENLYIAALSSGMWIVVSGCNPSMINTSYVFLASKNMQHLKAPFFMLLTDNEQILSRIELTLTQGFKLLQLWLLS